MANHRVIGEDDIGPIFADDDEQPRADGGPAFPQTCLDAGDVGMVHAGMTLRDWFAGQALADMVYGLSAADAKEAAATAYLVADAMLAERDRR